MESIIVPDLSLRPLTVVDRRQGGFGEVLVVRADDGQAWALKGVREDLGIHPSDFVPEVERLASLPRHPNVVRVRGVSRVRGRPYLVMDYWPESLRSLLSRGALGRAWLPGMLEQVARGLAHIHEAGVLHRDLKPENVLVGSDGTCAISDFGLARIAQDAAAAASAGEVAVTSAAGTPPYMSPEQLTSPKLTPAVDVWAFGALAFEALAGRHPFLARTTAETISNILGKDPVFRPYEEGAILEPLRSLVLSCLVREPSSRPDSATVAARLSGLVGRQDAGKPKPPEVDWADLLARANALAEVGNFDAAENLVDTVLQREPGSVEALLQKARIRHAQGKGGEAAAILELIVPEHLTELREHRELASAVLVSCSYYLIGVSPERARRTALLALDLDPEDWQALGNLAEACRALSRRDRRRGAQPPVVPRDPHLEEGIAACRKALALCPEDAKLKTTLGWLLLEGDDFARDFEEICRLVSEAMETAGAYNYSTRFLLIELTTRTGEFDVAEECLDPMRGSGDPNLQEVIQQADDRIAARKRELESQ